MEEKNGMEMIQTNNLPDEPMNWPRWFPFNVFPMPYLGEIESCPQDYAPFRGKCYGLFENGSSFTKAEVTCNAQGWHLAAFHSEDEFRFVVMLTMWV